jgi:hypothetical protein
MSYPSVMATPFNDSAGYAPSHLNGRTADERAKDATKYLQVLAEQRLPWEPAIDNLIAYVNHGRRSIQDKDLWPGQNTGMEIYDDTAMLACSKLVDGMVGYLCPRNQAWFALQLPGKLNFPRTSRMRAWSGKRVDSYPEVQRWLQDSQDVMTSAFNRSNFYDVNTEFIRDGASAGTGHLLAEEDVRTATIIITVPHFRECFIAENRFGQVDTNYRVWKWTLRQFVQKFGLEAMKRADPNFEHNYESNMHSEREVLHAVYPRKDYDPRRIDAKGKRWASDWVYRKGGKILGNASGDGDQGVSMLDEGGYDSMPILSWRWRKNSDEVYGRGPAHDAWVAIALANQMGRTNLITAQKAAEPPLAAYSDQRGQIQRGPNGITFLEANRGALRDRMPQPLTTGVQNLPFNTEYQERVGAIINEHFHADVFTMLSQIGQQKGMGRPVTEQIFEMQSEKAAVLGTRIGNLQSEAFDPLIARFFDIEARAGRIPEPPQILHEAEHEGVSVEYLGMLAQAQTRLSKVRSIQTSVALAQQVTQFDPLAIHAIDTDEMMREIMDASGMPASCMRPPKEIAKIREMAQKQQEQQQRIENAPKIAKAASLAGKAAEPDSPLKTLMGGGKAPGE